MSRFPLLCAALLLVPGLYGQVAVTGVVSAASWATPVAPGSIVAIFGTQLATGNQSAADFPLPIEIAGTSVSVNGIAAPLYYVSPGQINAELPSYPEYATPASATVVVTSPAGTSASFSVPLFYQVPAAFTADSRGCGQAAALNITPDGAVSVNSPSNSAQPGDYLAIFGTGFGPPAQPVPAAPAMNLVTGVQVGLGNVDSAPISYEGLAPSLDGVDQVNIAIPEGVNEGCAVPLSFEGAGYTSPIVSASIHTGRGNCADPKPNWYGQVTLLSAPGVSDKLTAIFPSGPNVQPPAPPQIQNVFGQQTLPTVRSCVVPGNTNIAAGMISIQGPGAASATGTPQTADGGGVDYDLTLPAGFIAAGQYTISSAPDQPATFSGTFTVDPPIQLLTTFPAGTALSARDGVTIRWSGGAPNDLVRVRLISRIGLTTKTNTYWATAGAGSLTLSGTCQIGPIIEGGGTCNWPGLPPSSDAGLVIDVLPPGGIAATSGATQLVWDYRYLFDSLTLGS